MTLRPLPVSTAGVQKEREAALGSQLGWSQILPWLPLVCLQSNFTSNSCQLAIWTQPHCYWEPSHQQPCRRASCILTGLGKVKQAWVANIQGPGSERESCIPCSHHHSCIYWVPVPWHPQAKCIMSIYSCKYRKQFQYTIRPHPLWKWLFL